VDHYGPASVDAGPGMQVPPHPHIGLQTLTWLFEGEVIHRDSLGSEKVIRPGQLNLMTAGKGVAHSEQSVRHHGPRLHGLQLWVALPDHSRRVDPSFQHLPELPRTEVGGFQATVLAGSLAGVASPARSWSELVGAELEAVGDTMGEIPLLPTHEHGVVLAQGHAVVAGTFLQPGRLLYLGPGREVLPISARTTTRLLLFGGQPLGEPLLMWWNFVARTGEEIAQAVADWNAGRFGPVAGYPGPPLAAPALDPVRLVARF